MTTAATCSGTPRVLVCLPPHEPESGAVVLAGALTLFGTAAELVLCLAGVDEPSERDAERVRSLCLALAQSERALPDIVLLGEAEARATAHLLAFEATGDHRRTAESIALMTVAAQEIADRTPAGHNVRRTVERLIRRRDANRSADPPLVVAMVQVQSTWGSIADVCEALAARACRGEIAFEVLALESEHDVREQTTAEFVRTLGYEARGVDWFASLVDDPTSPLALVLTDNPWDGLRPEWTRAMHLAERGIRLAYVPYGNNVGAGAKIMEMAYNLPLHQVAWRAFARSRTQRDLWERHCHTGAGHVRTVGLPKLDRVVRLCRQAPPRGSGHPIRELAGERPVVLWNPHFTFGPEGWSTFDRYLVPLVEWFSAHPEVVLLARPHFRLVHDLPLSDGAGKKLIDILHSAVAAHPNIVLDVETDYLPAFSLADALVSDLSSLITEWVPTGKPLCYLHKLDGPGANDDAQYFYSLDLATSWSGLEAFLATLAAGFDPSRDRRRLIMEQYFDHLDGEAATRIVDELVGSLRAELGLADVPSVKPFAGAR